MKSYIYEIRQFGRTVKTVDRYIDFARCVKKLGVKQQDIPKITAGKIVNGVCIKKNLIEKTPIPKAKKTKKTLLIMENATKIFDSVEEASKETGETIKNIKESINTGCPCDKTGYCFDYLTE